MQKVVVIGGSFGVIPALKVILPMLPRDFSAPVLIVSHIGARNTVLPEVLSRTSTLPVSHAIDGEPLLPGRVLLAPPDMHLTIQRNGLHLFARLQHGPKENHSRPAIDPLFRSAALACGSDAIGVILSGYLDDGTVGLQAIKEYGGKAIVQDPAEADAADMPGSALANVRVDHKLGLKEIGPALQALAGRAAEDSAANDRPVPASAPEWVEIENLFVNMEGGMDDLAKIGKPSTLTCPECSGTLWEIDGARPPRYRCHTGHAFTSRVLEALQGNTVEEAFWSAMRALNEQERLFRQLQEGAQQSKQQALADNYAARAERAKHHALAIQTLISTLAQRTGNGDP